MKHTWSVVLAGFAFAACGDSTGPRQPNVVLSLIVDADTLVVGDSIRVAAEASAAGAPIDLPKLAWRSTHTGVLVVNQGGHVTAVAPGVAEIVASTATSEARVTLVVEPLPVLTISPRDPVVCVGDSLSLGGAVSGRVFSPAVDWVSRQPSVVSVDSQGRAAALNPGSALIVAQLRERPVVRDSILVTVPLCERTIVVSPTSLQLFVGDSRTLTAVVSGYTDQRVSWTSLDPSIASVDNSGNVSAIAPGNARIEVRSTANPSLVTIVPVQVSTRS